MPVNSMFPVLDGIAPSWADVICKSAATGAALLDNKDIKAINTSGALTIGEKEGASGGRVIDFTTGSVRYEASLTLYQDGWLKLLENLKQTAESLRYTRGNQVIVGLVSFGLQIQFTPPGSTRIYDRRIKGARIAGFTANTQEGTEANEVEVPLKIKEIVEMIGGKEIVLL